MNLGLKDCKAFIAGASKGLGKACAKALADEGARIFICARNKEAHKRAASECDAAGKRTPDRSGCLGFCSGRRHGHGKNHCV